MCGWSITISYLDFIKLHLKKTSHYSIIFYVFFKCIILKSEEKYFSKNKDVLKLDVEYYIGTT